MQKLPFHSKLSRWPLNTKNVVFGFSYQRNSPPKRLCLLATLQDFLAVSTQDQCHSYMTLLHLMLTFSKVFHEAIIQLSNSLLTHQVTQTCKEPVSEHGKQSLAHPASRWDFSFFLGFASAPHWLHSTKWSYVNHSDDKENIASRSLKEDSSLLGRQENTTQLYYDSKGLPCRGGLLLVTKASRLRPANFRWR